MAGRPKVRDKKRDLQSRLIRLAKELEKRAPAMRYEHRKIRALARADAFRFIAGILEHKGISVVCPYGLMPRD